MPYIPQDERSRAVKVTTPGQLAYAIAALVGEYLAQEDLAYARHAEVFGVLETLKHELYRRLVAPYEDQALVRNGDVRTWAAIARDRAGSPGQDRLFDPDRSSGQDGPYRYEWRDGTC